MRKTSKEESYTSKQHAKVNYPKYKSQVSKEKGREVGENEKVSSAARPGTYTVPKPDETRPTRAELCDLIQTSSALGRQEARQQLLKLVTNFLKKQAVEQ